MKAGDGLWGRKVVPGLLDQNQQDYSTQVGRALGIQGSVPGHVDPTVGVGIQVDDLREVEFQYLRRCIPAYYGSTVAAVAAQFGFSSIRGGNGNLTIVEKCIINNTSAAALVFNCGIMAAFPNGVGAVAGTARDSRFGVGVLNTLAQVRGGNDVAPVAPALPFQVAVPAGQSVCLEPGIVLSSSGAFFSIIAGTVNLAFSVAWFWRERAQLLTEA